MMQCCQWLPPAACCLQSPPAARLRACSSASQSACTTQFTLLLLCCNPSDSRVESQLAHSLRLALLRTLGRLRCRDAAARCRRCAPCTRCGLMRPPSCGRHARLQRFPEPDHSAAELTEAGPAAATARPSRSNHPSPTPPPRRRSSAGVDQQQAVSCVAANRLLLCATASLAARRPRVARRLRFQISMRELAT